MTSLPSGKRQHRDTTMSGLVDSSVDRVLRQPSV
jgi:hypothetical protein